MRNSRSKLFEVCYFAEAHERSFVDLNLEAHCCSKPGAVGWCDGPG